MSPPTLIPLAAKKKTKLNEVGCWCDQRKTGGLIWLNGLVLQVRQWRRLLALANGTGNTCGVGVGWKAPVSTGYCKAPTGYCIKICNFRFGKYSLAVLLAAILAYWVRISIRQSAHTLGISVSSRGYMFEGYISYGTWDINRSYILYETESYRRIRT